MARQGEQTEDRLAGIIVGGSGAGRLGPGPGERDRGGVWGVGSGLLGLLVEGTLAGESCTISKSGQLGEGSLCRATRPQVSNHQKHG